MNLNAAEKVRKTATEVLHLSRTKQDKFNIVQHYIVYTTGNVESWPRLLSIIKHRYSMAGYFRRRLKYGKTSRSYHFHVSSSSFFSFFTLFVGEAPF